MFEFDTLNIDYNVDMDSYSIYNDFIYTSTDTNCRIVINRYKYVDCYNVTIVAHDGSTAFMFYTRNIESKNAQYD